MKNPCDPKDLPGNWNVGGGEPSHCSSKVIPSPMWPDASGPHRSACDAGATPIADAARRASTPSPPPAPRPGSAASRSEGSCGNCSKAPGFTASRPTCGPAAASPSSSSSAMACRITRTTSPGSCTSWASPPRSRRDGPWSGTRRRSSTGSAMIGRASKKGGPPGGAPRLHRRKRVLAESVRQTHVGASRPDAGVATPGAALAEALGHRRPDVVAETTSRGTVSPGPRRGGDPAGSGHRVPRGSAAASAWIGGRRVGQSQRPPKPAAASMGRPAVASSVGVLAAVRAGAESGGGAVVHRQASSSGQSRLGRPAESGRSGGADHRSDRRGPAAAAGALQGHAVIMEEEAIAHYLYIYQ
jgi:hypothetical protein